MTTIPDEATSGTSRRPLDAAVKRRLLLFGALLSFSSIFQMGYSNAYPNTSIETFRVFMNESVSGGVDDAKFTWIWSIVLNVWFIGFAIGSWIAVPVADRMGRKSCLLLGNSLNFGCAILSLVSILSHLWWLFTLSRFLFAIAAALSMNSLILLLQESAPPSMRGIMSFYAEMAFVLMNTLGCIAGMRTVFGNNLPLLVGLAALPTGVSVLITLPFHESPRFLLLQRGDRAAAARALRFYQCTDEEESEWMLDEVAKESAVSGTTDEFDSSLNEKVEEDVDERKEQKEATSISQLWTVPHLRKGLLLGVLSMQLTCSVWPVVYLSTELLRRANVDVETAESMSSLMLIFSSVSTVLGMVVVERVSRRRLFLLFSAGNLLALLLFVLAACLQPFFDHAKIGCIVALVLHGVTYSFALGPIAWFLTAELLPLSHRAAAQSIALSCNQLAALALSFLTLPLYDLFESFGASGALTILLFFVLPGAAALVLLVVHLPETRGVEINEVIRQLQRSPRRVTAGDKNHLEMKTKTTKTTMS